MVIFYQYPEPKIEKLLSKWLKPFANIYLVFLSRSYFNLRRTNEKFERVK